MNESTTEIHIVPLPTGQDVLTEVCGMGPAGCSPEPSRPRPPPGSTITPISRMTPGTSRWCATAISGP